MKTFLFMLLPAAIILTASRMCYYYYVLAHQSISIANDSTYTTTSTSSVIKHPRFIFGHSTGHDAGSTTTHASLSKPGCPWETVNHFERMAPEEKKWKGGDLVPRYYLPYGGVYMPQLGLYTPICGDFF